MTVKMNEYKSMLNRMSAEELIEEHRRLSIELFKNQKSTDQLKYGSLKYEMLFRLKRG